MSAAVVMPIQSLKNDAKIEEIESDIESPTARGRANHVNGGTADLSCNETHAEQVHLEKRSTHSAEPGPENTAPDGAGEVSGGAQQAVIIDDPPVETAVLEGTEQERYEAAKQIAESQGKLLRQACSDGDIDGILRLIDNKADVNSSNSSGTPPLHEAAHKGNPDAVGLLLAHGAVVDQTDVWAYTGLHFAAATGSAECCRILLALGADVDFARHDGKRPYDCVDRIKHPDVFELLILHSMRLADKRRHEKQHTMAKLLAGALVVLVVAYLLSFVTDWAR
eukprot:GEMP01042175.1.p1 GENE.GEMP01042175.1~~GEMP01042175.1.p1  ORF type:complete len:280 (+),score=58.74 GEMP01042175.1:272-1111(+)